MSENVLGRRSCMRPLSILKGSKHIVVLKNVVQKYNDFVYTQGLCRD